MRFLLADRILFGLYRFPPLTENRGRRRWGNHGGAENDDGQTSSATAARTPEAVLDAMFAGLDPSWRAYISWTLTEFIFMQAI